jgi:uncharacterized membrane protein
MEMLLMGLVLFLGLHSVRMVAPQWRANTVLMLGENGYKGLYSVGSLVGLGLIIWGYSVLRHTPTVLWSPPTGMRHLAALLTLGAFVLLTAAYVPLNPIKAKVGHPMVAGVKLWALAHLLANGSLADVLLFGSFLVWAVADFVSCRKRDRAAQLQRPAGTTAGLVKTLVMGTVAWAVFALALHGWLIGVRPLG